MAADKKIKIYSTATCVYCKAEKAFLDEKKIPYESVMVDEDQKLADELLELSGGLSVPYTVITTGDKTEGILGFDQPRLTAALGL
jgi:glutaredoxin 3